MSSIVVLRQDERLPDGLPALWDLDPTLLDTLCVIADRAAAASVGARFIIAHPRQPMQTLVSARWKSPMWRPVAERVVQLGEPVVQSEVAGALVEGPGGIRGAFLLHGTEGEPGRREVASAFAFQVEAAMRHAEARLASGHAIVDSMLQLVTAHDQETGRHSLAVKRLAIVLGKAISLTPLALLTLERAAVLHDLGKIGVPQAVLVKNGPLSASEWALMREHPAFGERYVRSVPELQACAAAIRHHHERWNGGGYPDRLAGSAIPLEARILALVDAYETIRAGRPYRPSVSREDALAELQSSAGTQFDPTLVHTFAAIPYHVLGL